LAGKQAAPAATGSPDTRARLISGALAQFNSHGFDGTDTNRIARQAGYAPQTFYRWFSDKTAIFIAAYKAWEDIERGVLEDLLHGNTCSTHLVEAIVAHHSRYKIFRRSLRQLSLDNPQVRQARAASRKRQIEAIQHWRRKRPALREAAVATALLQMERLADALAEHELEDMALDPAAAAGALAHIIETLLEGQELSQQTPSRPTPYG
jgi:AcrR family transcriptional regulator